MTRKIRASVLIFAVLVFSGIIIGYSEFSTSLFDSYGVVNTENFIILDKTENYSIISTTLQSETRTKITGIDPLDTLIAGVFSGLQFLFSIPNDIVTFITDLGDFLKLPGDIIALIGIIISLIVSFTVVEAITKGEI